MHDKTRDEDQQYIAAGEARTGPGQFTANEIARAFEVSPERVARALAGEFSLPGDTPVTPKMAQRLAEVLLGDRPLDQREAALLQLGGFTPRSDATEGLGDGPPAEESERQAASAGVPDDQLASRRSSHDPATTDSR